MAKAKSRSVSPPKMSMAATGISEVMEVLSERTRTSLTEWFAMVANVHFGESPFMFSLMRWNTTTVS